MVADGLFPFVDDEAAVEEAPRVGDGVMVIDARERITFASPNAVNALHRASITSAIVGSSLATLGLETSAIDEAFANKLPAIEEVERRPDVMLMVRCIPLISRGEVTGAAILLRDVTDLRRRDRLLLTKDATIREVHHRVKNNLQTISSLLRLQARRLDDTEAAGRTALLGGRAAYSGDRARARDLGARLDRTGALRRDRLGARQHDPRDEHDLVPGHRSRSTGGLGDVAAAVATPARCSHSRAPAKRHGARVSQKRGPRGAGKGPTPVSSSCSARSPSVYEVVVRDNGCGLPEGFDIDQTRSLGLSIVRDLVRSQLGGTITMEIGRRHDRASRHPGERATHRAVSAEADAGYLDGFNRRRGAGRRR